MEQKLGLKQAADLVGVPPPTISTAVVNHELTTELGSNGKGKFNPVEVIEWSQRRAESNQDRLERQAREARAKLRQPTPPQFIPGVGMTGADGQNSPIQKLDETLSAPLIDLHGELRVKFPLHQHRLQTARISRQSWLW